MLRKFNNVLNHYLFPLTHSLYILKAQRNIILQNIYEIFKFNLCGLTLIIIIVIATVLVIFVCILIHHAFFWLHSSLVLLATRSYWSSSLVAQLLLCYFQTLSFLPDVMHSISISSYWFSFFIKWSTQEITFHDSYIHLLRPSCSSSLFMTTGPALLTDRIPAGRGSLT